jgi:protein involved in polysaccharide export with SLBB domain
MMRGRFWIALVLLLSLGTSRSLFAQEAEVSANAPSALGGAEDDLTLSLSPSAQLALSTPDYPVTAGDVYTLAYLAGSQTVDYTITVDTSYRIRVSNLAVINAAGKTYNELKAQVESVVTTNYPMSGVQFVLKTPAAFKVRVTGEVQTAREVSAWALTRLSSLLGHRTPYGSIRAVSVTSSNRVTKTYDLFKARRLGDMSQDPYLRPNDVVTFNRAERRVTLSGAVERPGTYQPLQGENLKELIDVYGGGFTATADKTRMVMLRYTSSESISGDRIILKEQSYLDNIALFDLDSITIPDITSLRPVAPLNREERRITIEGAVRRPGTYNLMPEENLRDLIDVYGDGFTPVADKTRMVLLRHTSAESISGDRVILKEQDYLDNIALYHLDTITVPDITTLRPAVSLNREERRITIEGAVRRPGTYDLMSKENLRDLIEVYGDGLTPLADPSRIGLTRYVNGMDKVGNKVYLTEKAIKEDFTLENYDVVEVPSIMSVRPVLFVEGAVGASEEGNLTASNRITVRFEPGEDYGSLVRRNLGWFSAVSDTTNAYIMRNGERIAINLDPLLYSMDYQSHHYLEQYDTLVIPFRQYFVTVSGAVRNPGRYPYIPDRNWEYYVALAGGFNKDQNSFRKIAITDIEGRSLSKKDKITPETIINAETNAFLYHFNQVSPFITTTLSLIMTFLSLQMLLSQ